LLRDDIRVDALIAVELKERTARARDDILISLSTTDPPTPDVYRHCRHKRMTSMPTEPDATMF